MQLKLTRVIKSLLLTCAFIVSSAAAQVKHTPHTGTGIQFLNKDWQSVLAIAKKAHKPIFVDAYTTWCAPCQEMKQTTFKDTGIAGSFNASFVNVAIDVEKGTGTSFADQYQVTAYPTLLFINADGQVIKRLEGFADAKQLAAAAANIK